MSLIDEKYLILNKMKAWSIVCCLTLICFSITAQSNVELLSPSFEGRPSRGSNDSFSRLPLGWRDCGVFNFPGETPPDIHPNNYWKNNIPPKDGNTYLGMVVRDNETWESVTQRMPSILEEGTCYDFTVDLVRSNDYWSPIRTESGQKEHNYKTPAVLRIWGGTGFCDKQQLLGESAAVDHSEWKSYKFSIKPKSNLRYITLEAFYKTPTLEPYNGHILVDNISSFIAYDCDGKKPEIIAEVEKPAVQKKPVAKKRPPHKTVKKKKKPEAPSPEQKVAEVKEQVVESEKILNALDRNTIKTGQKIKIDNLYFAADSTRIKSDSYSVLNEVYQFLKTNKDVSIEIGGHTNIKPPHDFCDDLSERRAKEVADYLIKKGISPSRIQHKGYGKRQPIINSKSSFASKKNQRVEIKILSIG